MSKAIIFDLDGTLWDATQQVSDAWNIAYREETGEEFNCTRETVQGIMGMVAEEIGEKLLSQYPKEEQLRLMVILGNGDVRYLEQHGAIVYDGVEETFAQLCKTHDLYMVSNCQDGYLQAFLRYHKLEQYIRDFEMSGQTGLAKPDNIRLLMERNHIEEAVYVGDTTSDESAARVAGIPFIHAAYGFGAANAPDAVIHDITELPGCSLIQD